MKTWYLQDQHKATSWFIDKMTPNDNGIAAFEEDDYGTVAVQGEGEYGQKTFCFAYALAHLEDGIQGTQRRIDVQRLLTSFSWVREKKKIIFEYYN